MDVVNFFYQVIRTVVVSLFSYPLVDGLTFGWFLFGVMVLSVFIDFLFRRAVK